MAEIVAAASECESGKLHLWPEVGWVEILENNQPVPNGTAGDLVCTGLLNRDMPLIRYRVGIVALYQACIRPVLADAPCLSWFQWKGGWMICCIHAMVDVLAGLIRFSRPAYPSVRHKSYRNTESRTRALCTSTGFYA